LTERFANEVQVADRYRIERQLGQGGMGVVYLAHDLRYGRPVALKTLSNLTAQGIYDLKREFRTLADLKHPNLVALYELESDGDRWFFTMEAIEGVDIVHHLRGESQGPLQDRAEQPVPLEDHEKLRGVFVQLVEGVRALHRAHKLHCDLKPSNVLVTPEGRLVILDFGLVSDQSVETTDENPGRIFGTPAYMSPEQARGAPLSEASDWYSVGVILYRLLTGMLPFTGPPRELLQKKITRAAPPPAALLKGIPPDLNELCTALLRRNAEDRLTGADVRRITSGWLLPADAYWVQPSNSLAPPATDPRFVGRDEHLRALADAADAARRGPPVMVHVLGRSGMGKSALLRHFVDGPFLRSASVVLRGLCYERETVPYKALDAAMDSLTQYLIGQPDDEVTRLLPADMNALTRLFPVLDRVPAVRNRQTADQSESGSGLRERAVLALKQLLSRISETRPVILWIDDLHWGDVDSARLLVDLVTGSDAPPILLLLSYRTEPAATSPCLTALLNEVMLPNRSYAVRTLPVDGLSVADAQQLVFQLLEDSHPDLVSASERIARECDGIPLFITELSHIAADSDPFSRTGLDAELSLRQMLERRVLRQAAAPRSVLEMMAVAGRPMRIDVLLASCGMTQHDRDIVRGLATDNMLRTYGDVPNEMVELYHDRVREAVLDAADPEALRRCHAVLAASLHREEGGRPAALLEHWLGAGVTDRAADHAIAAADRAAWALAHNHATDLYHSAIGLMARDDPRLPEVRRRYADALTNSGRGAEAGEMYELAAKSMPLDQARALRRVAAQQYLRSGRFPQADELIRALLEELGTDYPNNLEDVVRAIDQDRAALNDPTLTDVNVAPPTPEHLEMLWQIGRDLREVDPLHAEFLHTRWLRLAEQHGDPHRKWRRSYNRALLLGARGNPSAEPDIRRAIVELTKGAEEAGDRRLLMETKHIEATTALLMGRFPTAIACGGDADALAAGLPGASFERFAARSVRFSGLVAVGELVTLARELPGAVREALEIDNRFALARMNHFIALMHWRADDPESAHGELHVLQQYTTGMELNAIRIRMTLTTTATHLYSGQVEAAWREVADLWQHYTRSAVRRVVYWEAMTRMARAAVALARAADPKLSHEMLGVAQKDAAWMLSQPAEWIRAHGLVIAGAVTATTGENQRAIDLLGESASAFDDATMRLSAAAARRLRATLLGDREGKAERITADALMMEQGIRNPARWTAMLATVPSK